MNAALKILRLKANEQSELINCMLAEIKQARLNDSVNKCLIENTTLNETLSVNIVAQELEIFYAPMIHEARKDLAEYEQAIKLVEYEVYS